VLNTLTEQDFHDALKNGRSSENGVYVRKGTTSWVIETRRSIVRDQMAAPVPEIMDTGSIYLECYFYTGKSPANQTSY
jgi:hypothetical protein